MFDDLDADVTELDAPLFCPQDEEAAIDELSLRRVERFDEIGPVLSWYVHRIPYLKARWQGGLRCNLDGTPAGPLKGHPRYALQGLTTASGGLTRWQRVDWPMLEDE